MQKNEEGGFVSRKFRKGGTLSQTICLYFSNLGGFMRRLVPLLDLMKETNGLAVRKVHYVPDVNRISFDFTQTGCSSPEKDLQTAETELKHEWYPFLMKDTTGEDILNLVPDSVPKFDLTLEGWSGYFSQLALLTQFSNQMYINSNLKTLGMPLSPAALRALDRAGLLDLIACDKSLWVATYARPDKVARKLKLQCMLKLTDKEINKVDMYDLDCARAYNHTAGILPIIRLQPNILVDEREFHDGGIRMRLSLPQE